jgi:PBP1b-binding outer membrane lipoprotein LpoB
MKKILAVLALAGVMVSCNNKKKDEKKPDADTTAVTPPVTDNPPADAPPAGVPKFTDPEVQKFANDYAAFMAEYKAGMSDPSKLQDLSAKMQDWSKRSTDIGMKLAANPEEAKAWADWVMALSKDMMPK